MRGVKNQSGGFSDPLTPTLSLREREHTVTMPSYQGDSK